MTVLEIESMRTGGKSSFDFGSPIVVLMASTCKGLSELTIVTSDDDEKELVSLAIDCFLPA